jgi:hypothetical protein
LQHCDNLSMPYLPQEENESRKPAPLYRISPPRSRSRTKSLTRTNKTLGQETSKKVVSFQYWKDRGITDITQFSSTTKYGFANVWRILFDHPYCRDTGDFSPDRVLGVSPNFQSPPKYGELTGSLDDDPSFMGDSRGLIKAVLPYIFHFYLHFVSQRRNKQLLLF